MTCAINWQEVIEALNRFQMGSVPKADGRQNSYIYLGAGDNPDIEGNTGAVLELAGNDVMPENSRGRAQLFSGNHPNGRIGMNIMHPDGFMLWQDHSRNTLHYQPSQGAWKAYQDQEHRLGDFQERFTAGGFEMSITKDGLKIGSSTLYEEGGVLKVKKSNGDVVELG
jgi:hypothetical protein